MSYTLHLFALDGQQFGDRMKISAEALVKNVGGRILAEKRCEPADAEPVLLAIRDLCSGRIPADCPIDYFDALCWMAATLGEPIKLGCFDSMKFSFFDRVAIWPWMRRGTPPFTIPHSVETPPEAGYLSVEDMTCQAFDELPPTVDAEVEFARGQFREILESLVEDRLDLLGVVM